MKKMISGAIAALTLSAAAGSALAQFGASPLLGQVLIVGENGTVTGVLADNLDTPRGTALAPNGDFFVSVTGGLGGASGFILKVNTETLESETIISDISPFDLEIDPISGDLFISDASSNSILRFDTQTSEVTTFATGFTPSGLGFAPNGDLFAGMQASDPTSAGTAGLAQIDQFGNVTQVGILDNPFDVQVDSQGNVFVNNVIPGASLGSPSDGEIAFFEGLGAVGSTILSAPIESLTFSPTAIRGLAIGPVGSEIEDQIFATTGLFQIVAFDPFDPNNFDPSFLGDVFAGPPISNIADPFAFDIQFLPGGGFQFIVATDEIPAPTTAAALAIGGLAASRRRRN
ncbi:MAG: hypothetical protein AAGJ54_06035 [Planctomycetota bacterium]